MILTLDATRELDQLLSEIPNPVVAEFLICNNKLCVEEHAIDRYIFWLKRSKRARAEKLSFDRHRIMCDLHDQLSASYVAKRENYKKENIAFRFWKGFLFILEWSISERVWLLKTTYQMRNPKKRGYVIKPTKQSSLAETWLPTYSF